MLYGPDGVTGGRREDFVACCRYLESMANAHVEFVTNYMAHRRRHRRQQCSGSVCNIQRSAASFASRVRGKLHGPADGETSGTSVATCWQRPQHPALRRRLISSWRVSSRQGYIARRRKDRRQKCNNMLAVSATSSIEPTKRNLSCTAPSMLRCVAMCCSVLQCVAVCCSVLQCVAVCCSVLQCVAVCCSVLQCVAVGCSVTSRRSICLARHITPGVYVS